ncbi:hypothetical protein COY28_01690 [Candidatus Woesearchaeota archaeon CG_4_10_14_0_2_um_filter_57_5]|nr:MAG: hypothetical protein COV94_05165 [Candidatus Woesearchaeota archaeon CG11_big_fil_rev_8_21_14_0_20_57_5]PIZ55620.1 MAG: hypothetical protein COY28_01690 [Candidatus Woesearchaeota archaeon CG_4_10_14_0_2_um_filter_57_5]
MPPPPDRSLLVRVRERFAHDNELCDKLTHLLSHEMATLRTLQDSLDQLADPSCDCRPAEWEVLKQQVDAQGILLAAKVEALLMWHPTYQGNGTAEQLIPTAQPLTWAYSLVHPAYPDCSIQLAQDDQVAPARIPAYAVQAVTMLLENAAKFGRADGRGNEPYTVHASSDTSDGQVTFTVCDYGQGMDPASCVLACLPGWQGEADYMTRRQGGLGMGLYITEQIARHHHGALELRSEQGQGTMAMLSLPVAGIDESSHRSG